MYKTITGIVVLILSLLVSGCSKEENNIRKEKSVVNVRTAKITMENVTVPVHTSGKVYSNSEKKLAFKTGGIIERIFVNEGQKVNKGKILARLNLSEINANVKKAGEAYEKAKRDIERITNLYNDKVATLEQKQDAETQLQVAKSNLEIAKFNKEHSVITAPANGYILKKLAEADELIGQGTPVFLFGSSDKNWIVKAGVADVDVNRISLGDSVVVNLDSYSNAKLSGIVTEIGHFASPYNGTFEIEVTFNAAGKQIRSGYVAKLDIYPAASRLAKLVPVEAIAEAAGNEAFVYTINNNAAVRNEVYTDQILGNKAIISTDLPVGTTVITDGSEYLVNGIKVNIVMNK